MPLMFNLLLRDAGLDLSDVRLLRHKDVRSRRGKTPYELWRDDRPGFNLYQSVQAISRRSSFADANYWASFGANEYGETAFLGVFKVKFLGLGTKNLKKPHMDGEDLAGHYHLYATTESHLLKEFSGRLYVNWGPGARNWVHRPERQNKTVTEFRRELQDLPFPGFMKFVRQLSGIKAMPANWKEALRAAHGVYVLTCPRTHEQYVGKADGPDGFLGRWLSYVATGHGGNVVLKSRHPSDYQVSILEVAGSTATSKEILEMEQRWMKKLQSPEIGLN